jgi:hypothetical protein
VDWLVGRPFEQQLEARVGVNWSGIPLRRALTNLGRNQRVAIMLDRRVDPDQGVDFSASNTPFIDLVRGVANKCGLGVSRVGPVLYLGPESTTQKLATLVELRRDDVRSLAPATRQILLKPMPTQWRLLTTPRQIARQLSSETRIRFYRIEEQIPHDLWPAGDLPPMGFAERTSLLGAGFGMTFEFSPDGTAIRFVPMPESVSLTRQYKPRGSAENLARQIAERFPECEVRSVGGEVQVAGLWEHHDLIRRLLRGESIRPPAVAADRPADAGETTVYTLKDTEAPAGLILKQLAPRLGLKLWVDPRIAARVQKRVRVDVKDVTRDELLDAVVEPVGAGYTIRGDTLEIVPKN